MPRIVKLGELLPADFVIEMPGGQQFTLPGDPPLDLILKIAELFERSENADQNDGEFGIEVLRELDAELLRLIQMRQPDVYSSPFGVVGVMHVVETLLQAYNFAAAEDDEEDPENPPQATRSRRSSGSRSSSSSSGSRRTTGGG